MNLLFLLNRNVPSLRLACILPFTSRALGAAALGGPHPPPASQPPSPAPQGWQGGGTRSCQRSGGRVFLDKLRLRCWWGLRGDPSRWEGGLDSGEGLGPRCGWGRFLGEGSKRRREKKRSKTWPLTLAGRPHWEQAEGGEARGLVRTHRCRRVAEEGSVPWGSGQGPYENRE